RHRKKWRSIMVEIPEEAVQAAEEAVYARHERGFLMKPLVDPIDMRAALTAAAPFLQGVKVKALDWTYIERVAMTYVTSDDRGMLYYINQSFGSDSYYFATVRYADGTMLYDGDDIDAAKAAAQADFEARILSA